MSAHLLLTEDGKKVVIDITKDERIYDGPNNPPNTGTNYTRGTDLYLHITRKNNRFFYLDHWSMWQGEEGGQELITEDQARNFLIAKAQIDGWGCLNRSEIARAEELFPGIFEEDA